MQPAKFNGIEGVAVIHVENSANEIPSYSGVFFPEGGMVLALEEGQEGEIEGVVNQDDQSNRIVIPVRVSSIKPDSLTFISVGKARQVTPEDSGSSPD